MSDSEINRTPEHNIDSLTREIDKLKDSMRPDDLARRLEQSYFSINNLRAFLQILSLIFTVFLAGVATFGYLGVRGIIDIREHAEDIKTMRIDIHKQMDAIQTLQSDLSNRVYQLIANIESNSAFISARMIESMSLTISNLSIRSHSEITNLQFVIKSQEKLIKDVRELARGIYKNMLLDTFKPSSTNNYYLTTNDAGTVYALHKLNEAPIPESMRIQQNRELLLPQSYNLLQDNIIFVVWDKSMDVNALYNETFYVSYIADPEKTNSHSDISFNQEGRLMLNGVLINPAFYLVERKLP